MTAHLTSKPLLLLTHAPSSGSIHARSQLIAWTPHTSIHASPRLKAPAHTRHTDTWLITVADAPAQELWLSGDFNNWRLPGLRMHKTASGTFESTLHLPPTISQFACYQFIPSQGFRRIPSETVECLLIRQSQA